MIEGEESKISKTFHYAFQDSTSHRQKKNVQGKFCVCAEYAAGFSFLYPFSNNVTIIFRVLHCIQRYKHLRDGLKCTGDYIDYI